MTRKDRSFIFTIITSIFNIVITLVIIAILTTLALFLMLKLFHLSTDSIIVEVVLPFVFIAGLIIGLSIFTKFAGWLIRFFHLEEKLLPDIVRRYCKNNKQ